MEEKKFDTSRHERNPYHVVYVKREIFPLIEEGAKTLELRIAFGAFSTIEVGDIVEFKTSLAGKKVTTKIIGIRRYSTLEEVFEHEDIEKIAPDMSEEARRDMAGEIFNEKEIKKFGMMVIEFEKL